MSNLTLRVPTELMERLKRSAARNYSTHSDAARRILRLGLDADERLEQGDSPAESERKAS